MTLLSLRTALLDFIADFADWDNSTNDSIHKYGPCPDTIGT